ncbi:MAG TPA: (d)CMP kinase [Gemmatimonadaceae bacterium]|nr:(d)CMP kinase [Gemmatimonadaceae bacterium]
MSRRFRVIAIDGPAASGKSSTAQMVADKLGYLHVDSGSVYRAATAAVLRRSVDAAKWDDRFVLDAASSVELRAARTSFYPVIEGKSVEDEIRGDEVTRNVSRVAQMPQVRDWVNGLVRGAAMERDVVVDGRDMGTAVFPEADLKIFLIADPSERALRRLRQRGELTPSHQLVATETGRITERDLRDSRQTFPAPDAVVIDTTLLAQEEQVEQIVSLARRPAS